MVLHRRFRSAVWLFGAALGFALGCSIPDEQTIEPCEHGANNFIDSTGTCVCWAGYEFCDPDDPMNLDCCAPDMGTGTGSGSGTDTGTGTGTETGTDTGEGMPCASGMNNQLDENGECLCQVGFEWCDPADANDLNCCPNGGYH